MFEISSDQASAIFPIAIGSLAILLAVLNRQLLRCLGRKPSSEAFTTPKFKRSARITEILGRLFLMVMGTGFLIQGVGARFISGEVTYAISLVLLGLSGLIVLVMFGIVLANWKA